MKIRLILAAIVAIWLVPAFSMAQDVIPIGNSSVKVSSLTQREITNIFMGKKIAWDDKTKIVLFFQKDPIVHNAFLKKYIHKNNFIFERLWKRLVFTGKVKLPKYLESDTEMIEHVSTTKGAIGYVSAGTRLDNVKTITVK